MKKLASAVVALLNILFLLSSFFLFFIVVLGMGMSGDSMDVQKFNDSLIGTGLYMLSFMGLLIMYPVSLAAGFYFSSVFAAKGKWGLSFLSGTSLWWMIIVSYILGGVLGLGYLPLGLALFGIVFAGISISWQKYLWKESKAAGKATSTPKKKK